MTPLLKPWQLMVLTLAGWINRSQQEAIEYLRVENQVLAEQLKGKRLRLTDEQRRKLAIRGRALGRRLLAEVATLMTPDTILAWHRKLIAQKWTYPRKGVGRPPTAREVEQLVLRMAEENPGWGYTSLVDRLRNLGHEVGRTTVAEILKANGLEPATQRRKRTSWRTFIQAHWSTLAAIDFTTVEVWTAPAELTRWLPTLDSELKDCHVCAPWSRPHCSATGSSARSRSLQDGSGRARPPPLRVARSI